MEAAADDRRIGPTHEARPVPASGGDLADHLTAHERAVGRVERRAVAQVDLHLTGTELGHHTFEAEVHLLDEVVVGDQQTGRIAERPGAVHTVRGAARHPPPARRVGVGREHVELELVAEVRLEADRPPRVDGADEGVPRADRDRRFTERERRDGDVGVGFPTRPAGRRDRGGVHVGVPDVAAVPVDRLDGAVDPHHQGGDGVVGVLRRSGAPGCTSRARGRSDRTTTSARADSPWARTVYQPPPIRSVCFRRSRRANLKQTVRDFRAGGGRRR